MPSLFLSFLRVEVVVIVVVARRFPCYTTPVVLVRFRVISPPCRYHIFSLFLVVFVFFVVFFSLRETPETAGTVSRLL